jgi:formylglycine-generating enzyme required for sulfatase activity
LSVPGGDFFRSYDGISTNGASKAYSATVSTVSLDKYEVTVGRFRAFVAATVGGWHPAAGAGKHSHLNGGAGLNGGAETGWDSSWDSNIAAQQADWTTNLSCEPTYATWTSSAGANEDHPINCVDWFEAYAFCIWDGGFLPTEAEWNYAAAGGDEQRVYPWSAAYPPGSTTLDCSHANYSKDWPTTACVASGTSKVGADSPLGDGKWGHCDLAGNVFEWALDWFLTPYAASCNDCAELSATTTRVIRGGGFDGSPACLLNSLREDSTPLGRSESIGLRCARAPE